MSKHKSKACGFTLAELLVSMTIGLIVLGAAANLYSPAVQATWVASQRSEMQQDFRAASDLLQKDISLAGAGLPDVGIPLPTGGTPPVYGCDQTGKCYINNAAAAYPQDPSTGQPAPLYGLVPGYRFGPIINGLQTDVITLAYVDTALLLNCYNVVITSPTTAQFSLPNPLPGTCVLPPGLNAPQALNDPAVGLTPGDVIWFQVSQGLGAQNAKSGMALAEVTAPVAAAGNNTYNVTFGAGDTLKLNQIGATGGTLTQINGFSANQGNGAYRMLIISYFVDNTGIAPRFERMIDGHTPIPVAENVMLLNFSYDLYNNGALFTNQPDGGQAQGLTPKQLTKVNIVNLAMRSTQAGTSGYQGLDLQTSISLRNLTFNNNYPLGP
ncbi:MAG: prepilin-type N-terminal cleavage/methylation domain-containing protein [Acidobacteria bacterium]|nr:prepilin-type N-terminal cleavage/methylation domain-containing protein [Acidobacteriota bacterium]